jgi:integrase
MASLEKRGRNWRVLFRHQGQKRSMNLGGVSKSDAEGYRTSTEELLELLERGVVALPEAHSLEEFLFHRGKPPAKLQPAVQSENISLTELRSRYFISQQTRLEQTTLDGISLHFDHLERIIGRQKSLATLTRNDLQQYVETRGAEWIDPERYAKLRKKRVKPKSRFVKARTAGQPERPKRHPSPATIKKELVSLRTALNWARRTLGFPSEFPGAGLEYAKIEESLPFMTFAEAKRRIKSGDSADRVWECLYLQPEEIDDLLRHIQTQPVGAWVHPMVCVAAHTGMRRSEIVRILVSDVDFETGAITIREKKRDRKKLTTRQVPLSQKLLKVLLDYAGRRGNGVQFFCLADGIPILPRSAHTFLQRALKKSEWSVLRGWHIFRHSFISALASNGIDQRLIDDLVGHQTEEQRRRYRHLYPNVKHEAIRSVFG